MSDQSNSNYSFVISSAKSYAKPSEYVYMTLTLKNESEYELYNLKVTISVGPGAELMNRSLMIDGISYSSIDISKQFSLPKTLASGSSQIILTYVILIDDDAYDPIYNSAIINFSMLDIHGISEQTNTHELKIVNSEISMTQTDIPTAVIAGQTITYAFTISNDGNMTHKNLTFTDTLPEDVTFVEGSVKINSTSYSDYNPVTGFIVKKSLLPSGRVKVQFDVTVND